MIARPSLEDVLAQGAGWRLEQTWSPAERAAALSHREAAPYLMRVVDGRAVILDHGVRQADGSWHLADAVGPTGRANLSADPGASISGIATDAALGRQGLRRAA